MNPIKNEFERLGMKASRGDTAAVAELREQLEPQLLRMVRRAVRTGADGSALSRSIRAAIDRVQPGHGATRPQDEARLARHVSRHLCQQVINGLNAGGHNLKETVVA